MSAEPSSSRVRAVEGSYNVRDLGGLPTASGGVVRRGRVFRSDYPGFAAVERGLQRSGLGLSRVVDLRRGYEAAHECVPWPDHGVDYHRVPLSAGPKSSWHARYQSYLTYCPETVVRAVALVMEVDAHPVLFHCAAGKDRTGVVAALTLSVLGVPEEEIVADYVYTEHALDPILDRLLSIDLYGQMLADSGREDQRPLARNMEGLLDWLQEQGGAETWLVEHGLDEAVPARFREAMLSD